MRTSDFDYELPPELIAQEPLAQRDQARLLVYNRADQSIQHRQVSDLPNLLPPGTMLVANNSCVRKGRLYAKHSSGRVYEVLLLEHLHDSTYRCLVRGKQPTLPAPLQFITGQTNPAPIPLQGTLETSEEVPGITTFILILTSNDSNSSVEELIAKFGVTPLPPYITNTHTPDSRYQTVYAGPLGSAAAPTAGLHLTPRLLETLIDKGHHWHEVTLHVGIGTFLPLRSEIVEENQLHQELTSISSDTAQAVQVAIAANQPVLAVGTTSLRTLEGHFIEGNLQADTRSTNLFIYPGYHVRTANLLLTNFHLPKSSLLMLVAAFLGNTGNRTAPTLSEQAMIERVQHLYHLAVRERYRFFSFGDAMLIL